ncbi:helix-turn-helix domain-containing protein [Embleya sp. NPDC020630]|uniref:helix-turn-helix domain-containing protein n=1 Tax=Embleya sp. NPDC020630 TaxID=3363979 RepID=UPI0037B4F3D9
MAESEHDNRDSLGLLLRQLRMAAGMTQEQLAAELNRRAGVSTLSRTEIARYERGRRRPVAWLPLLADVLGVSRAELQNPAPRPRALVSAYDLEESVIRRNFLAASVVVATADPWGRLAHALNGRSAVDAGIVASLNRTAARLYDAEEHHPARALYPHAAAHLDTITALLSRAASTTRTDLIALAGQTAVLAGWLAYDIGQTEAAQGYYRTANEAARQAGDDPLAACVLAYISYQAEPPRALELLRSAQKCVRGPGSAAARSWFAAREAEECSTLGDREGAVRALDRAHTAYDYADPTREQPWVRFFRPARLSGLTVSTLGRLRHPDTTTAATRALEAAEHDDAKIRAVVLADVATAMVRCGDLDRGVTIARRAVDVTRRTEATLGRQRLASLATQLPATVGADLRAELRDL